MGSEADYELSSTPKLSLFSLPNKLKQLPELSTPPIHTLASVPFQWEEAPGKPRPCNNHPKSKAVRCLELPPRLLNQAKVDNMPSPTTVLDGPYFGHHQSLSRSRSVSLGDGTSSFTSFENLVTGVPKGRSIFGSGRWGSFRKSKVYKDAVEDSTVEFSASGDANDTTVKILRIRRKSSFFSLSSSRTHFLTNMYESFKQVVPWRRR